MVGESALHSFGAWLESLRKNTYIDGHTLTQFEVAVKTGLTTAAVSRLEVGGIGKPPFEDICKLMVLYGQSLEEAAKRLGYPVPPVPVRIEEVDPELVRMWKWLETLPEDKRDCVMQVLKAMQQGIK